MTTKQSPSLLSLNNNEFSEFEEYSYQYLFAGESFTESDPQYEYSYEYSYQPIVEEEDSTNKQAITTHKSFNFKLINFIVIACALLCKAGLNVVQNSFDNYYRMDSEVIIQETYVPKPVLNVLYISSYLSYIRQPIFTFGNLIYRSNPVKENMLYIAPPMLELPKSFINFVYVLEPEKENMLYIAAPEIIVYVTPTSPSIQPRFNNLNIIKEEIVIESESEDVEEQYEEEQEEEEQYEEEQEEEEQYAVEEYYYDSVAVVIPHDTVKLFVADLLRIGTGVAIVYIVSGISACVYYYKHN